VFVEEETGDFLFQGCPRHAIKGISPDAPVQAHLRRQLDAVLAEQEDRARLTANA